MYPHLCHAVVILLLSSLAMAQRQMSLTALIAALQQHGMQIVYSSDLVSDQQQALSEEVSLEALARSLAAVGLALESRGEFFVVVRGPKVEPEAEIPRVDSPPLLENVIVTGSMHRFPYAGRSSSSHSFSIDEIGVQPALASDPLRIANRLPGVSSLGVSAKPKIRGGLADELLIMQDGVELLEPFHMADFHSVYSSIDYHSIESLDIYTGGFPSRYGNRMSGVMDIQSRARDDDYNVDLGVATFARFATLRGDTLLHKPVDYSLSYRQGDLSDLAEFIDRRSGIPEYRDLAGRINFVLDDRWRFAAGASRASDDIAFEDEEETALSEVRTNYFWASANYLHDSGLRASLTASWLELSRYDSLLSIEDEEKGGFLDHRQHVDRFALRNDWSAIAGSTRYEFGWQLEFSHGNYRHRSEIDRGVLADIIATPRLESRAIDERPRGWAGGAYMQCELALSDRLTLQPSLRLDLQDYFIERDTAYQLSPRLGLSYMLRPNLTSRVSVGRFHQPEGVQELQILDGINRFFAPQHSDQLVFALDWQSQRLELLGEVYFKRYGDQKTRFENVFNPFVLLPGMESDRVRLDPTQAIARGADLSASLTISPSLSASFRYSHMNAQDRIGGRYVDRRWSQRHTVNAGMAWQRGDMSLSLATTWHSGWRTSLLPEFVAEGEVIPIATVLNNTELREFFSLDLSARKSWELPRARLELYADISNITDRKNQAGIDFDPEDVEGGYELLRDRESLLGRVISLGATLSF